MYKNTVSKTTKRIKELKHSFDSKTKGERLKICLAFLAIGLIFCFITRMDDSPNSTNRVVNNGSNAADTQGLSFLDSWSHPSGGSVKNPIEGNAPNEDYAQNNESNFNNQTDPYNEAAIEPNSYSSRISQVTGTLEQELCIILSSIEGIGQVEVMVTLEDTGEQIPMEDLTETQEGDSYKVEKKVIIANGAERESVSLRRSRLPALRGILVVAEGVEDINLQIDVIEAIRAVTGLSDHRIKVLPKSP